MRNAEMQRPDSPVIPSNSTPVMANVGSSQVSNSESRSATANRSTRAGFREHLNIDEELRIRGKPATARLVGVDYHAHLHAEAKRERKKYRLDSRTSFRRSRTPWRAHANQQSAPAAALPPIPLVPDSDKHAFPSRRELQEDTKDVELQGVIYPGMDPEATYSTIDLRNESAKKPTLATKKSLNLFRDVFRRNREAMSGSVVQPKAMQILGEDEDFSQQPAAPPRLGPEAIRAIASTEHRKFVDRSNYRFKVSGLDYSCQGLPPSSFAPSDEAIQSCVDLSSPYTPTPLGQRSYTDMATRPKLKKAKSFTKLASVIGVRGRLYFVYNESGQFMAPIKTAFQPDT
jgi:hypothetical protein